MTIAAITRTVVMNQQSDGAPSTFASNSVTNTKYTLLTFLPYNLWEQFS